MTARVSDPDLLRHQLLSLPRSASVRPVFGLTNRNAAIEGVTWTPDGRDIVYSLDEPPASRLWRIPANTWGMWVAIPSASAR